MRALAAIFMALWLLGGGAQAVFAEKRVALVIGNANYRLAPLPNALNDADAVAAALKRLRFEVTVHKDLRVQQFDEAIEAFDSAAKGAGVALFFFSGHGVQINKQCYLVPADFKAESESRALPALAAVPRVVARIGNAANASVFLLDACGGNPLQEHFKGTTMMGGGAPDSFEEIQPVPMPGSNVLVVYAAAPGGAVGEAVGHNSAFTAALLKHIETPGLEIEQMLQLVTDDVLFTTSSKQQSERYSRLRNDFVLADGAPPPVPCDAGVTVSKAQPERQVCIEPGSKETFKDCPQCPEMVVVPKGSFMMGSPESEPGRESWLKGSEGPRHNVTIPAAFAVGRFAVTFEEWEACVAGGGCGGYKPNDKGWGRGNRPVINISWNNAQAYAAWLSEETGKPYRLLTDAEFEYVARAGTTTPFHWGSSIDPSKANYDGTVEAYQGGGTRGEYRQQTLPVKSFKPNGWGLYQVHGNVYTWVQDCWAGDYEGAPADGSAITSRDCLRRTMRGGSWYNKPSDVRAAYKNWYFSTYWNAKLGLRVARSLEQPPHPPTETEGQGRPQVE